MCVLHTAKEDPVPLGIAYVQEQLSIAVAITERRQKNKSHKPQLQHLTSNSNLIIHEFKEVLPRDLVVDLEVF
jgi:hypothetical protein